MTDHLNLLNDGLVVRRSFAPPVDIALIKSAVDKAYELVEAARDGVEPKGPQATLIQNVAQSTIHWGGIPISQALEIASLDYPEAPVVFARLAGRAESAVAETFGKTGAVYRGELSYFRRHKGTATHVPWHFDAGAAGTAERDPCFNVWTPLVPVGIDCPTLQFLRGTGARMKAGAFEGARPGYPDDSWISRNVPDSDQITPALQPGDVVIFDHWTLHRTQPLSGTMRTSAEIRLSSV